MPEPKKISPMVLAVILVAVIPALCACCEGPTAIGGAASSEPSTGVSVATTSVTTAVGGSLEELIVAMGTPYPDGDPRYVSSNPYDYIKDNPYYDRVVAMGYDALPELEQYLKAGHDGLDGYLACIAIEAITSCDLKQFDDSQWGHASQFEVNWDKYLKGMRARVDGIMTGGGSPEDKRVEIAKLGAPAVPYVVGYAESIDAQDGGEMADTLHANLQKGKPGSTLEGSTVEEVKDNNNDLIAQLLAYVENR
jgi:hypothetical protein